MDPLRQDVELRKVFPVCLHRLIQGSHYQRNSIPVHRVFNLAHVVQPNQIRLIFSRL